MKPNTTHLSFVLDRSGSMNVIVQETIDGFNRFLADQKSEASEATFTLVQFDDEYEILQNVVPLASVEPLTVRTFVPRGSTALLDAVGETMQRTGKHLADLPEAERPERVIFVVLTDGMENASHEYTYPKIAAMIQHQREKYGWEFVFLGANQDAMNTASEMGMDRMDALSFAGNAASAPLAFDQLSRNVKAKRSGNIAASKFRESEREEQRERGAK
ncbi:MAG: VWA domain-containing protein [Chthonomonadaceae bacterium]|nr:VWA domain-containing protein [Chthonomonadaceae bacterium]